MDAESPAFFFIIMEYSLLIDQNFACRKDLTLTEAACMAVVFTFPRWCNSYCIDGVTYYWYSEKKVSEDFPLVFGCAKRVQKNLKALADKGYFILSKLGNKKVIAFTDKCRLYGKLEPENGQDLDRKRSEEPENGPDLDRKRSEETENGPDLDRKRSESGPKTVRALYKNTINNNDYNNNKSNNAKNGFFAFVGDIPQKEEGEKIRGTSEKNKCLFEKSRFFDFELFRECFNTPEFEKVDLVYYYNVVKDWSASKGRMQKDWIAQTRNIIRADYRRGQIKYTSDSGEEKSVILGNSGLSYGDLLGVLNEDFE
nr:MAG: helix-turn-helix domain protein [Bacteriophage sp.]